jgi:fatty acid desaturase
MDGMSSCGDSVAQSLVFCEVFCRFLLVILSVFLFFWQLLYLSFFELPILITPFVIFILFLLLVNMFCLMNIGEKEQEHRQNDQQKSTKYFTEN